MKRSISVRRMIWTANLIWPIQLSKLFAKQRKSHLPSQHSKYAMLLCYLLTFLLLPVEFCFVPVIPPTCSFKACGVNSVDFESGKLCK